MVQSLIDGVLRGEVRALARSISLVEDADPRAPARDRFAAEFGARAYADWRDLLADPAVDAVYIAAPHQFHAQQAVAAAQAGKHVLVEKPMALSLDDCRAMARAAAQAIGVDVDDPAGDYLLVFRQLINWPIDADGLIIGEDAYQTGPVSVTKLGVADLPQAYIDQKNAAAANA